MRKLILTFIILLITFFAIFALAALNPDRIYFLDLEYNKGSLKLIKLSLITGFPNVSDKIVSPYKAELLSTDKSILFSGYFEIPNKIFDPPPRPGEEPGTFPIELDKVNFGISLPYLKNGQEIRITKDNQELLVINVSEFQMYCGDGKCQFDENHNTCPEDCIEKEGGIPPQPPKKEGMLLLYAVISFVIVAVVILILRKLMKKKEI